MLFACNFEYYPGMAKIEKGTDEKKIFWEQGVGTKKKSWTLFPIQTLGAHIKRLREILQFRFTSHKCVL